MKTNFRKSISPKQLASVAFLAIFAIIGSFLILQSSAAPTRQGGGKAPVASMWITPSKQRLTTGQELKVQVWADGLEEPVNAVTAVVQYPVAELEFVSVQGTQSAYGVEAESTGGNGIVTISRGNTAPLTGPNVVAEVTFRVLDAAQRPALGLAPESQLLRVSDNTNILAKRTGAQFSIAR